MNRPKELIVTPAKGPSVPGGVPFPDYLRGWMVANGYETVQQVADYLGVKRELVYMMLSGGRDPSEAVREKVGIETVWRVTRPAKGKK
jgi:excisionase family DNA binding protein